ncbi:hypothetical protein DFP72DRAFT_866120 [Ephemerocybe angulata]|uniref:Xylanolytic transcriptional activator regulatory domain-containing protein n=1 Tax=Ephemerocybe angulata TaxID=980116 RepID=A0A8H6IIX3_9AGAR|nr:hypothetical protein DFP72DRAFT_866120 [Tulosesus angulatus]
MPRVESVPLTKPAASSDPLLIPPQHPNVLKRNQCRRRKLRPCSTCVRSHAHAVSHAPPGTGVPSKPDCTFDEIAEAPKNKYERLENRIAELESLLRQKDQALLHSAQNKLSPSGILQPRPFNEAQNFPEFIPATVPSYGLDLTWPGWPPQLPPPDLLKHLVEVFFVFHPHASRLFHVPTFMSTLSLPASHPKFPATPILHGICAVGSLYTAADPFPDEIFLERLRVKEQRPDSFAERHAKLAKEGAERMNTLGENLFQVFQANIILTWFYWSHGRWIFLWSAHTTRLAVPLGLYMCPPFHSITKSERPPSIISPARSVIEDETRRNAFWLSYAVEREHGCSNGWAQSLDDQDISQLLPTLVPPSERQWAHSRDVLYFHPEDSTDSFGLYIKGLILVSKIKTFNARFRSKHFSGDNSVVPPEALGNEPVDPRGSQAFIELDQIVSSFNRNNFPPHLRNPILDNVVDNHLYTAFLLPHIACILLHDPHAEVERSGCMSALKILTAARAILDLIYDVSNTSFDITLLDSFCSVCWFLGGRVLIRFLQAALDSRETDQIITLRTELDFIHISIAKIGQRIPLAYRFSKMLKDLIKKRCGNLHAVEFDPYIRFGHDNRSHGSVQLYDQMNETPSSIPSIPPRALNPTYGCGLDI